ncbi:MAG: tRNA (cmo5U34)-methyltransferase [Gammaproteobacteria bacterium]|nr:MAG: tRNA (cmo5U34)-methyltransferase [Gammaproteobacteria bacterium]
MFKKDTVYQNTTEVIDFDFDKKVAQVFPDMVHRSVPGYASLLTVMQAVFRAEFANRNNLLIYDLGCSVGGVTLALSKVLPVDSRFIGVDISADMLTQYQKALNLSALTSRVEMVQQNIVDLPMVACQGISLNFILQFLNPDKRQRVLDKCYRALDENGLVFIAEKTRTNDDIVKWHEQFKRNNGYSELEIAQKRLAIENVMKIDKEDTVIKRCQQAGFKEINQVFHALGFKAWVITK